MAPGAVLRRFLSPFSKLRFLCPILSFLFLALSGFVLNQLLLIQAICSSSANFFLALNTYIELSKAERTTLRRSWWSDKVVTTEGSGGSLRLALHLPCVQLIFLMGPTNTQWPQAHHSILDFRPTEVILPSEAAVSISRLPQTSPQARGFLKFPANSGLYALELQLTCACLSHLTTPASYLHLRLPDSYTS